MATAPTTWLDPSIWKDGHSDIFRAAVAGLTDDDVSFLRACFAAALGTPRQLLAVGERFVTMMPGFPGAGAEVREAGRAILDLAVQAARAGAVTGARV